MSEILTEADIVKHRNCALFVDPPEAVLVLIDSHEALRARVRALEHVVRMVEWARTDSDDKGCDYCAVCGGSERVGHDVSCELAAVLR